MKPQRKVGAAGLAGAVSVLAVWGLSLAGITAPPEVAAAFTAVLTFAAGYLVSS